MERNRSRTGGRRRRNRPRDRQSSDSSAEHGSQDEPAYEVLESDDAYILGLHVPGHDRRHLTVEVTDDTLTVTGEEAAPPVRVREHASDEAPDPREETRSETEEKGPDRQRPDRGGGDAFESRFEISGEVADEELSAAYRDGILAIRIPKHALSTPGRRIEITFPED